MTYSVLVRLLKVEFTRFCGDRPASLAFGQLDMACYAQA